MLRYRKDMKGFGIKVAWGFRSSGMLRCVHMWIVMDRSIGWSFWVCIYKSCRSQWPRLLRPLACWDCVFESHRRHGYLSVVSVVCCQVCDELITRPQESYRLWCVVVCDLEPPWMRSPWPTVGCGARRRIYTNLNLLKPTGYVMHQQV
jgi:hypothetical protein